MFDTSTVQLDWQGLNLKLETGLVARQAMVLWWQHSVQPVSFALYVHQKSLTPQLIFSPSLYITSKKHTLLENTWGFFKREGRPSEIEILNSRLIDRPMRPLFHKDFKNETQIVCTVLNYDGENDPAICAMIGAFSSNNCWFTFFRSNSLCKSGL